MCVERGGGRWHVDLSGRFIIMSEKLSLFVFIRKTVKRQ